MKQTSEHINLHRDMAENGSTNLSGKPATDLPSKRETLMEKYKKHFELRKREPIDPKILQRCVPWWFLFTVTGAYTVGTFIILPALYDQPLRICQQILATFLTLQILMNWYFSRYVDSKYSPDPMGIVVNNVTNSNHDSNMLQNGSSKWRRGPLNPQTLLKRVRDPEKKKHIVQVQLGNASIGSRREYYPYWSWKPCPICGADRPPRAHHCKLCKGCILKRDHHCYFSGTCIGHHNQRFFVMLVFWSAVTTSFCLFNSCLYIPIITSEFDDSYWILLPPVAFYLWICLETFTWLHLIMVLLLFSLFWLWVLTVSFTYKQTGVITTGLTDFEKEHTLKIVSTLSRADNIKQVFGENWKLNFLFPAHKWYPNNMDDGIQWKNIKVDDGLDTELTSDEEENM